MACHAQKPFVFFIRSSDHLVLKMKSACRFYWPVTLFSYNVCLICVGSQSTLMYWKRLPRSYLPKCYPTCVPLFLYFPTPRGAIFFFTKNREWKKTKSFTTLMKNQPTKKTNKVTHCLFHEHNRFSNNNACFGRTSHCLNKKSNFPDRKAGVSGQKHDKATWFVLSCDVVQY